MPQKVADMNRIFKPIMLLAAGTVLFLVAVLTPAHWKVVVPEVLEVAGMDSDTVDGQVEFLLQSEKPGVVSLLESVPGLVMTNRSSVAPAIQVLLEKRPVFILSGGAEPYFESIFRNTFSTGQFNEAFGGIMDSHGIITNTASLFLNQSLRLRLFEILSESNNGVVKSLLKTRGIRHFNKLKPIDQPTGAALDVSVLTTALLVQSDFVSRDIAQTLQLWADRAFIEANRESEKLEVFYLALLNLSSRLGYLQLAELTRLLPSTRTLVDCSAIATGKEGGFPLFYAASLLTRDPAGVAHWFLNSSNSQAAILTLTEAVNQGAGAVHFIVRSPDSLMPSDKDLLDPLKTSLKTHTAGAGLTGWVAANPRTAFWVRILCLWAAGLFFTMLAIQLIQWNSSSAGPDPFRSDGGRRIPGNLALGRNAILGLLVGGGLWFMAEPVSDWGEALPEVQASESLPVALPMKLIFSTTSMNTQSIDQPTIIVLVVFLLVQLALYFICRMKLAEIRRADVESALKLELLANEENLFDSGLYVGLGGTVLALSMVTLGMVEASLMAAYASTLFGILFVAVLKIFNIRPLRRQLLMDSVKKKQD